ncbi:MAG: SlyX family protein [Nitratireductor sp.]|nr:SlyX family protein [Nitratireductor sp.]
MENQNDRVTLLEELVAHQAKSIEELSQTVAEQWQIIDATAKKLEALTNRFLALEAVATPTPEITRPPHY